MKVEIWSDFMCPFCYIGKRQLEKGLQSFIHSDKVEIEWRSFQLDPHMESQPGKTIHEVLADKKGWSLERAKQISMQVTNSANQLGLNFDFDKAVPTNTFHAHRLSQLAAKYNLQDEMEERLFSAYFTEGKNIGDIPTLFQLAIDTGLPDAEVRNMLETNAFAEKVEHDGEEALQLGVRGVPFFVIDRKYAISGAQPAAAFTEALETAWKDSRSNDSASAEEMGTGACVINGNC